MPIQVLNPSPERKPRTPLGAAPPPPAAPDAAPQSGGPIVFAAPHRAMFLSGATMLLIVFALWAIELAARVGLAPSLGWAVPPAWAHALLVLGGVLPFFIFGFLFTAMPRWQGAPDLTPAQWLWPWRLLAGGWGLSLVGLWWPPVLAAGLIVAAAGWAGCLRLMWHIAFNEHPDPLHARIVWWAIAAGGLGVLAWVVVALGGGADWARAGIGLGVWCFLVPVFFTVCHRMVPFFSSSVIPGYVMVRPRWALRLVVAASVVHGLLTVADAARFAWLVDLPAAAVALWLSYSWRPLPALRVPLLGMLHLGFAWLGVALTLFALQGLAASVGSPMLGLAPLHALTVGFFGSVMLAMVSRVTLGHSGRPLVADRLTWGLFLGLEAVVLVRVAADLVPWGWSGGFMLAAVLGWLAVFMAWAARYLPAYWRARADGREG